MKPQRLRALKISGLQLIAAIMVTLFFVFLDEGRCSLSGFSENPGFAFVCICCIFLGQKIMWALLHNWSFKMRLGLSFLTGTILGALLPFIGAAVWGLIAA